MRPKNASRVQERDSYEDEATSSQRSTVRSTGNSSQKMSGNIVEQLVNDCVHYLLIANQKGYPIKKTDIMKHVVKDNPKAMPLVISKASDILKKVFGIDFYEVENKKGHYLLTNRLDFKFRESNSHPSFWSDTECAHHGLLMIILVVIFMSGNVVQEAMLWQFLKKLGLDSESDRLHPLFGNVKKLICQEFVRKLYLEHKLVPGSEPPVYEFRFGQRAIRETSKKEMLILVCQLFGGDMKIDYWAAQHQDAMAICQ